MCGISGIVRQTGAPVQEDEIRSINDLIVHRGPDAEGFFFGDGLALGHRRLSILDLSDAGNQPMTYLGRHTITYNGEIYNYIELKDELSALGYRFATGTDTEVILAAYDQWGEQCVAHFNGMWAFALYDRDKQQIFCSRDRFGIKPFYYTQTGEDFVFCSEIKQALAVLDRNVVNLPILVDYLVLGLSEHTSETFFSGVHALEGGCNLVYDLAAHKFSIYRYYRLQVDNAVGIADEDSAVEQYKALLVDSVRLRLRSDVKVGTCLSGGLDSSSIAAIAAELHAEQSSQPIAAITAASTNPENDESHFARMVADRSGINLNLVKPTNYDFQAIVQELVRIQEEPFSGPSLVMQYYVFESARRLDCKVMLDGQGGDETLLGYERYFSAWLLSVGLKDAVAGLFQSTRNSRLTVRQTLAYFLYFLSTGIRKKFLRRRNRFINREYLDSVDWRWLEKLSSAHRDIIELQQLELTRTQLPHLLRYEDRNSMAHSIESRLPFLDYRLVELALSLPSSLKIKGGWTKFVLRKGTEDVLPPEVSWRTNKFGFEAPAGDWLRAHREEMQQAIDNSAVISAITETTSGLSDTSLWMLYFVAVWESVYDVHVS